jgi:hypothetical protein
MIRFYPRDIGRWRGVFNFPPKMIPLPDFKEFESPQEFLDFLVEHKVRFDDTDNRLMFVKQTASDKYDCIAVYDVIQWTSIGRIEVSSQYIIERLNKMVQQ